MVWRIDLSEPDIGLEEINAVTKVLQSKWLTMGSVTKEFESKFSEKMNVKHAIAVNNCTAALHLANLALGIGKDDEVICPALTFIASANATRYTGANVVFGDIVSEHDLTIDPEDIKAKISNKTKAITVVHFAGFSCLMNEVLNIAKENNLKVIEDCAHSPFGIYPFNDSEKINVGGIGDVGCFSFFGNKNMTTGEGGMITTNDDLLAEKICLLRSHGMTTLTYERYKGHANNYDVVDLGYNYRTDEIHSAIGLCQLRKIDYLNQRRRVIYQGYIDKLKDNENVIVPFSQRNLKYSTCHIMPLILKNNYHNIKKKLEDAGVQTSKHYQLIPSFSEFSKYYFKSKVEFIDNILTLPLSPMMSMEDVDFVCQLIKY